MRSLSRFLAIPLLLTASAVPASGDVRDKAGLFSPDAVKKANAELERIEADSKLPIAIETITSLDGQQIGKAMERIGDREGIKGLFVLISAKDHKVDSAASPKYGKYFSRPILQDVWGAFLPDFKRNDYDAGLMAGVAKIDSVVKTLKEANGGALTPVANPVTPARRGAPAPARPRAAGGFGLGSLIGIVLLVVGVLFVVRLLGALMNAGRGGYGGPGGYGQGPMRGPGGYSGPGYGPGYGGGGGGGGFMSSMFGGIGGALAGNWLYDRFSGRHQQGYEPGVGGVPAGDEAGAPADPDGGWVTGGEGGDWGGGGGDTGGGGDWGGGGGGGGDWGGGGGGGDGGSW